MPSATASFVQGDPRLYLGRRCNAASTVHWEDPVGRGGGAHSGTRGTFSSSFWVKRRLLHNTAARERSQRDKTPWVWSQKKCIFSTTISTSHTAYSFRCFAGNVSSIHRLDIAPTDIHLFGPVRNISKENADGSCPHRTETDLEIS